MSAASLTFLSLDFLLMEMAASSSALMLYKAVVFLLFLFSPISLSPEDNIEMEARRKGSSALSSTLSDLTSVKFLA